MQIPLAELADIRVVEGPSMIKSENARRSAWIIVDLSGRDIADAVNAAGGKVDRAMVVLDKPIKTLGVHPVKIKIGSFPDVPNGAYFVLAEVTGSLAGAGKIDDKFPGLAWLAQRRWSSTPGATRRRGPPRRPAPQRARLPTIFFLGHVLGRGICVHVRHVADVCKPDAGARIQATQRALEANRLDSED